MKVSSRAIAPLLSGNVPSDRRDNISQGNSNCISTDFNKQDGYRSRRQVVGFTAARVFDLFQRESAELVQTGPEDAQEASSSDTVSIVARKPWKSNKISVL